MEFQCFARSYLMSSNDPKHRQAQCDEEIATGAYGRASCAKRRQQASGAIYRQLRQSATWIKNEGAHRSVLFYHFYYNKHLTRMDLVLGPIKELQKLKANKVRSGSTLSFSNSSSR